MRSIVSAKILTQASDTSSRSRTAVAAAGFFVAVVSGYAAARLILRGDLEGLLLVALGVVGIALVIAVLNDWRGGVYAFFAWLLVEDLFRKFLGSNMAIYFAKDALLALVYLSFFLAWRGGKDHVFLPRLALASQSTSGPTVAPEPLRPGVR